jgi:hypothetical protein
VEINPHPSGITVDLQWPVTAVHGLSRLLAQLQRDDRSTAP